MPALLTPIAAQTVPCKCCGGESRIFGVVDFNQNCEWRRQRVLEPCGIPIYYHRCRACGFLFTIAFDHFSQDDFLRIIYNEQYVLVDPDYLDSRPQNWAKTISQMFAKSKDIRILDYGGGNGKLGQLLRADGFTSVDVYDPFVPAFATRPRGRFDLVISVEVVEHSPRPAETFADLDQLVGPSGMVIFTTLVQAREFEESGVRWWYVAPRNGHVSIFSRAAIQKLAEKLRLTFQSFNDGVHVLRHEIPTFARHLFASGA